MKKRFGLAFMLAMLATPVHATDLLVGQWSRHMVSGEYNETHKLIGVELDSGWGIARFKNSYNGTSFAVGYRTNRYINCMLVTGYDRYPVFPYCTVGITLGVIDFNILPGVGISAGFRWRIK